jgi:hypothetical protein
LTKKWVNIHGTATVERNKENTQIWTEYHKGKFYADFQFVSQYGYEIILFDPKRNFWVKLTNEDIRGSKTKNNITGFIANGKWEIEDSKTQF